MGTRISGRPTFGGLASGLDTNALLEGLMAIERQPLQRIESRRAELDNQRSLMRQLNTRLLALRDAAAALDNRNTRRTDAAISEELLKYSGSSSNDDVVEVSAGAGASPGEIQIRVEQLARGSRRFSNVFNAASASEAIALQAGQSMTIALPNADPDATPPVDATSITIAAGTGTVSLSALRDRINASADNGGKIRADVLQSSEGSFQLVVTSTETGAENEIAISGDLAIQAVNPDGSDNAQSAVFHLFGQRIERQTNEVEDVLTGITLRLKGVAERDENDQPITETVTVSVDVEEIATGFEAFISAYNDVQSFIDNQSKYNETTKTAGPFSGDSILRDIQSRVRRVVSTAYRFETNPNNPYAPGVDDQGRPVPGGAISGIGIEVVSGGRLRLDRERLEEVLAQDPLSMREFLSGRVRNTAANQAEIDRRVRSPFPCPSPTSGTKGSSPPSAKSSSRSCAAATACSPSATSSMRPASRPSTIRSIASTRGWSRARIRWCSASAPSSASFPPSRTSRASCRGSAEEVA
jgi:flagellar hook-associated protein 2